MRHYNADSTRPCWNEARYYNGQTKAVDAVAPSLSQFASRRIREQYESEQLRTRAQGLATTESPPEGMPVTGNAKDAANGTAKCGAKGK